MYNVVVLKNENERSEFEIVFKFGVMFVIAVIRVTLNKVRVVIPGTDLALTGCPNNVLILKNQYWIRHSGQI